MSAEADGEGVEVAGKKPDAGKKKVAKTKVSKKTIQAGRKARAARVTCQVLVVRELGFGSYRRVCKGPMV